MPRRLGLLSGILALMLPCVVYAQSSPSASDEMIEQALRDLKVSFTRSNDGYAFRLNDRPMTLASLHNGQKLLIKAMLSDVPPSLRVLNRYNEEVAVTTRAVLYKQEGVVLEAGLDCRIRVTTDNLKLFVAGFGKDVGEFAKFAAKVGNDNEPPARGPKGGDKTAKGPPIPLKIEPGTDGREVEIAFPSGDSEQTAWKIVWDMTSRAQATAEGFKLGGSNSPVLFRIKKAYFRPGRGLAWVQVLEDAHPSEFYVPYFFQANTRFFDLRDVGSYVTLHAKEGSARSQLLGKERRVMAELRDRGLAYKHGDLYRRGEEFALWANFQAGNYTYLVEFCFHDDGTIAFKHSPTGYNYYAHFDEAAHMHNVLWRIGVKLTPITDPPAAGKANNQVSLVRIPYEPEKLGPAGKLDIKAVPNESFFDWDAKEFTRLRVSNPDYTVFPADAEAKLPISYDLVATMQGQARHHRFRDEGFSLHDFWVTRADCPEKMYINLPQYFAKQQRPVPLQGADGVVLWHMSSGLHVPRSEDGIIKGNNLDNGQALVSWTSVELRPRNLFTKTPLYGR